MYVTVSSAMSIASVVYIVCGTVSALIAYDFFLTKDGALRKILIGLFLAWAMHYLVIAYLFVIHAPTLVRVVAAMCLSTVDFCLMITLYLYMKWRH